MQAAIDALALVEAAAAEGPAHKSAVEQGLAGLDTTLTALTASTAATSSVADAVQAAIDAVTQVGPHSNIEEHLALARAEFD